MRVSPTLPLDSPTGIVAQHPDVWIVRLGFRRRQENEVRLQTSRESANLPISQCAP
jgi:hypothetical protein